MLPWFSPYVLLPLEGAAVWVRRTPWYDTPVRAVFSSPDSWTVSVPSVAVGIPPTDQVIKSMVVHSWKFQFLADQQLYDAQLS